MSPRRALLQAAALLRLPPRVAVFYLQALLTARRTGDRVGPNIAARPVELRPILRAAKGARWVAEIGTGTAWTAAALTLADPERRVVSLDVLARPERDRYVELMPAHARRRLSLVVGAGERGPGPEVEELDFLFIDSSHEREETVRSFGLWSERLRPGGVVAFHDHGNPSYPGVTEAIRELGLEGEESHLLFLWRKPA